MKMRLTVGVHSVLRCKSYFKCFNVKFYISALVGVIIKVILQNAVQAVPCTMQHSTNCLHTYCNMTLLLLTQCSIASVYRLGPAEQCTIRNRVVKLMSVFTEKMADLKKKQDI